METIVRHLEEIIKEHGMEYLQKKPYEVYCKLITAGGDDAHARLVLITLLSGASTKAKELDTENLSRNIKKECYLRKEIADEIASMYNQLFDTKNIASWKKRKNYGFREFCSKSWEFNWFGSGTWRSDGGHMDCRCDITAEIEVLDKEQAKRAVSKVLEENPFTPAEKIYDIFSKQMSDALNEDLEDYVTCEDYYPPVMEDYYMNGEDTFEKYCNKLGLRVLSFDCDGSISDFEPDHMRW